MRVRFPLALANDLVAGRVRDQMGEPFHGAVSPSRMVSATACASDRKRDMAGASLKYLFLRRDNYLRVTPGTVKSTIRMETKCPTTRARSASMGRLRSGGSSFNRAISRCFDHSTTLLGREDASA